MVALDGVQIEINDPKMENGELKIGDQVAGIT